MSEPETGEAAPRASFEDWKRLDLMPGVDERAVRGAYARKLKTVKPDADPEGFQALREAYERVLAEIRNPPAAKDAAPTGTGASGDVDQAALAGVAHAFEARRRRGDAAGALAVVDEALSGALRLGWRHAVEDALFDSVADDRSTRPGLLQGLAQRFDWREATTRQDARNAERMQRVRERIDAADYVDKLRARVTDAAAGKGPAADRVLVTILGPYRVGLFDKALEPEERAVAEEFMAAMLQHLGDIDGLIDPRMLAAVRAALCAAPLVAAPPGTAAVAPHAPPVAALRGTFLSRLWSGRRPAFWLFFAVVFAIRIATAPPTHVSRPAGETAALPQNLDISTGSDGSRIVDLKPVLTQANVMRLVRAVRVHSEPDRKDQEVDLVALASNPNVVLAKGTGSFTVSYLLWNGTSSDDEEFNLKPAAQEGGDK